MYLKFKKINRKKLLKIFDLQKRIHYSRIIEQYKWLEY